MNLSRAGPVGAGLLLDRPSPRGVEDVAPYGTATTWDRIRWREITPPPYNSAKTMDKLRRGTFHMSPQQADVGIGPYGIALTPDRLRRGRRRRRPGGSPSPRRTASREGGFFTFSHTFLGECVDTAPVRIV